MDIRSERVNIKDLECKDVYLMRDWGLHENPLIEDYNFPPMSDIEIKIWYRQKTRKKSNRYYSITNEENKLIGYMGIKHIKRFRRESTLGIVFDPNYVDKGYGTETLNLFLEHYFLEMKMKKMILEVAKFNKRAYRVYEKMGFKEAGYYLDDFFDPNLDLSNPYYTKEKSSFVIKDKKIYNYVYRMILSREKFMELRDKKI